MTRAFRARTAAFRSIEATFDELEVFVRRAIRRHKARFGDDPGAETYSAVEEAERVLQQLGR